MRILDLLKRATEILRSAGIQDAAADAEILALHATGIDRLAAYRDNPKVPDDRSTTAFSLVSRRAQGEPVQYITGEVEFLGLRIKVGKGVLIPRPETELLAQEVIRTVRTIPKSQQPTLHILDLCTGSGCIALALAQELPHAFVFGTDISGIAIGFARENSRLNGIGNVTFLQGAFFEPLQEAGPFDVILSNPPYVRREEIARLQREIREWEPMEALDGGPDGLDCYRSILAQAGGHLKEGGMLFLELGYGQANEVSHMAVGHGFRDRRILPDFAGIARVFSARREGGSPTSSAPLQ